MKAVLVIFVFAALGVLGTGWLRDAPPAIAPFETVTVGKGKIAWRPLGNFSHQGKAQTPRPLTVMVETFEIMKYQVSRTDYALCVAQGACADVAANAGAFPQTGVSWEDATAFAVWYSVRTGDIWRLPSETQWQRAAAERYGDAAPDESVLDPGKQMVSQYRRGVFLRSSASPALRPRGGFGENSFGIADMAGSVWEWTDGCMENGEVRPDGTIDRRDPYCGVRIAGGRHRAAVIDFVRDASVGGCAMGLPPDHLGFRLVRDADLRGDHR
ncbi:MULTISPECIES: formylglycine-generating enzyme family protein [Roseobacteraceae]|uniref:Sulfatase-modifying factor enzyme 1 n=1 Tax=Pseudosulfitobacter pseudonitzschiae TaxID=1402135 RepID=A0A221K617_9RHOB|nr:MULTISPECIES: SUMF1/EgtB/PvdO family nonheme iron enzyme [Roseobacteraceae]ASM74448.1 sulfatase-modifying factor enzyme 1 [Pseudosulfitobacter pseudonitzschiae]